MQPIFILSVMTDIEKTIDTTKYDHGEIGEEIDKLNRQLEELTEFVLNTRGNVKIN